MPKLNRSIKASLFLAGLFLVFGKLFYDLYSAMSDPEPLNLANDLTNHIWPFYAYISDSIRSGVFPLWNPYVSVGNTLIGEIGIGLFHPTNWTIFIVDNVPVAMLISQLLTVLISAVGAYFYSRYLGLQWSARILCLVLFGYAAATESFSQTAGASSCWFPAIMYLTHRCFDRPTFNNAISLSVVLALCFFGGFANYFVYTCLIVGVFFTVLAICSCRELRLEGITRRFGLMLAGVILMTGFVAIQLLPAYELSSLSVRNVTETTAYIQTSIWEKTSPSLLFANFLLPNHNYIFGNSLLKIENGLLYIGGALVLIPFAFTKGQHRATAIALTVSCLVILCFVLSAGISALSFIQDIPVIGSLRIHSRGIAYIEFILILLAALGLSAINTKWELPVEPVSPISKTLSVLFPAGFAVAIAATAISVGHDILAVAGLLICSGLIIYYAIASPRISNPGVLAWVIAAVIIIDVAVHREYRYSIPAFSKATNPFGEQSAQDYRSRGDQYRTLLVPRKLEDTAEIANSGMILGIPNVNAYDPLTHARWRNFIRAMIGPDIFDGLVTNSILGWFYGNLTPTLLRQLSNDDRILGLASLRYRYSKQGNTINEYALPRAYAVHHYIQTGSEEESLAAIKDNIATLNESVVLENANPSFLAGDYPHALGRSDGSVVITRYTPNEIELSVNVSQPAIVVLTDAFYPGWVAYVDGRETTVFRANSLFRAVDIPAGDHTVLYRFRPTSFYLGTGITLSTICFALVLVFALHRRRSHRVAIDD